MKNFIIIFISIVFFNTTALSEEFVDCSKFSKLSPKYYTCKTGNFVKETKDYQKKEWSEGTKKVKGIKKKILD